MHYIIEKPGIMSWTHNPLTFRLLFGILIILVFAIVTPVSATVWTLNPSDIIQDKINSAAPGDTILLNPGTYNQHTITVSKNIIIGANTTAGGTAANTIIDAQSSGRIFDVGGYSLTIDNLTLQNGLVTGQYDNGGAIVFTSGTVNVTSSSFINCSAAYYGGAIFFTTGGHVNVISSSFSNCSSNGGGAILTDNGYITVTSSTFTNCTAAIGDGGAIFAQHNTAVTVTSSTFTNCSATEGGAISTSQETLKITSSTFTNCSAKTSVHGTGTGGALNTYMGTTNVTSTSISNCSAVAGGAIYTYYGGTLDIHFSRFDNSNTGTAVVNWAGATGGTIDASNNWWGTNADPSGYTRGNGVVTVSPWLVLGITAVPSSIDTTQTSTIRTNMTYNSAGTNTASGGIFVPDGIKNTFAVTSGSGSVSPLTNLTINGIASSTFTPVGTGTSTVSATVDGQPVSTGITVTPSAPSAPVAAFTATPLYGAPPLAVQFNDTSTNTPTAWNWSFTNVTGNNTQVWFSTAQNLTYTFGVGNYSIVLNASNNIGYNISTQVTFINVTNVPDEIDLYRSPGVWILDYNRNNAWDGTPPDKMYGFGATGDKPIVGDWNQDKKKEIGVFRSPGVWILDQNGNYAWDGTPPDKIYWFGATGDTPVVGDWNGNGLDKIGLFRSPGVWILDYNGNYAWDGTPTDKIYGFGATGDIPILGDWNGDGQKEIGLLRSPGVWILDYNGNYAWDGTPTDKIYGFGADGDIPIVGDWNGDGKDEIGVLRSPGVWVLDYNGNYAWDGTPTDKIYGFGATGDVPVNGKW